MESMIDAVRGWLGRDQRRERGSELARKTQELIEAASNQDDERFAERCGGECLALGLGMKPAVYLNGYKIDDPRALQNRLRADGMDASCSNEVVIDNEAIRRRVREEPDLARAVGWNPRETAVQQFEESMRHERRERDNMRIGFILGIPGSAIRGFDRERKIQDERGMVLPSQIFRMVHKKERDPSWEQWLENMEPAHRSALKLMAYEHSAMDLYDSSLDPSSEDEMLARAEDQFYAEHGPILREIYRAYTTVTEQEAEHMLSRRRKSIHAPDGSEAFVFVTYGPDGRNAPDVRRLETKAREAFRKLKAESDRKAAA